MTPGEIERLTRFRAHQCDYVGTMRRRISVMSKDDAVVDIVCNCGRRESDERPSK